MVLEKILESALYNKEFKPVSLKGNQPVTPADSVEESTEGLQVERMDASTAKLPHHVSSKQIVCGSTPGGSSERLKALCNLRCILPNNTGSQGRSILGPGGRGWLRDPLGPPLTK